MTAKRLLIWLLDEEGLDPERFLQLQAAIYAQSDEWAIALIVELLRCKTEDDAFAWSNKIWGLLE